MAKYRTALGKTLDLSALAARNEKTRAVGNMKVNARGDSIDAFGNIIKPVTEKVTEAYSKTVGNRAAQPVKKQPRTVDNAPRNNRAPQRRSMGSSGVNQRIDNSELTSAERELNDELYDDMEVEKIKAAENKNGR